MSQDDEYIDDAEREMLAREELQRVLTHRERAVVLYGSERHAQGIAGVEADIDLMTRLNRQNKQLEKKINNLGQRLRSS